MRLWHKDLIPVLPREQLVTQWRECSAIAGAILKNGTPNHILVNKVLDYNLSQFVQYSQIIRDEMTKRGYRTMDSVMNKIKNITDNQDKWHEIFLFEDWHTDRYFKQCYYNLQEKYDCGGIKEEDWKKIEEIGRIKYGI